MGILGKESGGEKEEKGRGGKGNETKGSRRRKKGKKRGREEICAVVICLALQAKRQ